MLRCAKVGKEKKNNTAAGAGKEWKKHWIAKATLPCKLLPVCAWEPWCQAQRGSRGRIRGRAGRESKHRAVVGHGAGKGF